MKKLVISEFSGIAFERNEFAMASSKNFHFALKLLVTNSDNIPISIVNIFTVKTREMHSNLTLITFIWKDLLKTILTEKLKEMFGSEKEFRVNFLEKGLKKIGIEDEKTLMEKFPNIRELIILLNDTNRNIDVNIHDEVTTPKIFSSA